MRLLCDVTENPQSRLATASSQLHARNIQTGNLTNQRCSRTTRCRVMSINQRSIMSPYLTSKCIYIHLLALKMELKRNQTTRRLPDETDSEIMIRTCLKQLHALGEYVCSAIAKQHTRSAFQYNNLNHIIGISIQVRHLIIKMAPRILMNTNLLEMTCISTGTCVCISVIDSSLATDGTLVTGVSQDGLGLQGDTMIGVSWTIGHRT